MTLSSLIPILSLATLLAVAVFALVSKARTEQRKRDPNAPVSTLATDGKYGGVPFLNPALLPEGIGSLALSLPGGPQAAAPATSEPVWPSQAA